MIALAMSLLTSKFAGPLATLGCVILLAVSVSQCSGRVHAEHKLAKLEKAVQRAEATARKREVVAARITDTSKTRIADERARIEYRTKTLVREVPTYVTVADDARCTVNAGFVRLHDAAASGSPGLPGTAGGSDETASGVPLSAVAETVVFNYGAAYDWKAEALGWRDWYTKQKAAWDK